MQQTCVDDALMNDYPHVNDTDDLDAAVKPGVDDVVSHKCEPFDCNGHGRCDKGCCVCSPGMSLASS